MGTQPLLFYRFFKRARGWNIGRKCGIIHSVYGEMGNYMKFLHMADVHLGKYAYTNSARYQDLFDAFASAVQYGIQQEIDVLLVAGDLFDIRNVNSQILFQTIRI